jgi:hypothetical protein
MDRAFSRMSHVDSHDEWAPRAPACESQMCSMPGTAERGASGSLHVGAMLGASMLPDAPPLLLSETRPPAVEARPPP